MINSKSMELKAAVREDLKASENGDSRSFLRSFLVRRQLLVGEWAAERIEILVRQVKREMKEEARPPDPYQMFLPGFRSLEDRVYQEDGYTTLGGSTIADLRKGLKLARAKRRASSRKKTKDEERLEKAIEAMEPYARRNSHITYEQYCKKAAAESVHPSEEPKERPTKRVKRARY